MYRKTSFSLITSGIKKEAKRNRERKLSSDDERQLRQELPTTCHNEIRDLLARLIDNPFCIRDPKIGWSVINSLSSTLNRVQLTRLLITLAYESIIAWRRGGMEAWGALSLKHWNPGTLEQLNSRTIEPEDRTQGSDGQPPPFHISVILTTGNCQNPTGRSAGQRHTSKKNIVFFARMSVFYRSLTFFRIKTRRKCPEKLLSLWLSTA